jgi:hypothetical protein
MPDLLSEIPQRQSQQEDNRVYSNHCSKRILVSVFDEPRNDCVRKAEREKLLQPRDAHECFEGDLIIRIDNYLLIGEVEVITVCDYNSRYGRNAKPSTSVSDVRYNPMRLMLYSNSIPIHEIRMSVSGAPT